MILALAAAIAGPVTAGHGSDSWATTLAPRANVYPFGPIEGKRRANPTQIIRLNKGRHQKGYR